MTSCLWLRVGPEPSETSECSIGSYLRKCEDLRTVTRLLTRICLMMALAREGRTEETNEEGLTMPLVQVKLIEGVFDDSQKRDIVTKLTDAMVEIEGENMRGVTWVVIDEVKSGQWGIGGNPLTTADVKALAAGAPVG